MSSDDRRIARFVEDLLHNRRPRRFRATPEELTAMRAAAALRSARAGAELPDPAFVDRLGRRLRRELDGSPDGVLLSRRGLLVTAGSAAAAAVAGGAAGAIGGRLLGRGEEARELVPAGATWRAVMAAGEVEEDRAVRFSTGAVEGFVVNRGGRHQAISAVCTHLGCILQPEDGGSRLSCPCHRTGFAIDGSVTYHELRQAPPALPTLRTRVRDGLVEVFTA
jgi:nitrite reductase/ring-hydroxylating ferredoxin subunit